MKIIYGDYQCENMFQMRYILLSRKLFLVEGDGLGGFTNQGRLVNSLRKERLYQGGTEQTDIASY